MKRSKKICFGLLLVFSIIFGSFLNVSSDVNALDDVTVSFGSDFNLFSGNICGGSSGRTCSDYSFLYFSGLPDNPVNLEFTISGVASSLSINKIDIFGVPLGSDVSRIRVTSYYGSSYSFVLSPFVPGSSPEGSLSITENGTYDVSQYAEAVVNVENEVIQGDYHDDLVSINNSILICAAVCLVIYFFYAIYRMILGGRR